MLVYFCRRNIGDRFHLAEFGHQPTSPKNNFIFQSWMKILPTPYRPAFETLLKTNSTFTGPKLHSWIDSGIYLNSKFYLTQFSPECLRIKLI